MIRSNNAGSRNAVVLVNYCTLMDAVFFLNEADRTNLLQLLMQSFGCTYICLWSYITQPFNCLTFHDGCYKDESNQPSSPTGTLAWRLFLEYQQSRIPIENDSRVPGFAFRNSRSYFELRDLDLQRLSSNDTQRQFYLEARIKRAVFMGFRAGEIELGFSNETQINIEMGMREFFPEEFLQLPPPQPLPGLGELPQQLTVDPNPTMAVSSSSSSLRSLSTGSPEYSSLIFNIPSLSHIATEATDHSTSLPPISRRNPAAATNPHHQAMQALCQIRTSPLPSLESEHAIMTQAFLAALTSPPPSSTSALHHRPQENLPYNYQLNPKTSAFKRYATPAHLAPTTPQTRASLQGQNMLNRSILYYKRLHAVRRQLGLGSGGGSHPTSTQLQHIMLERKRREKLNESIQTLKSLLPPGTKDKISVLNSTSEYLSSLIARVSELSRKNQLLETQLLLSREAVEEVVETSSNERTNVRIIHKSESTSEERFIDLRISVRGECCVMDMLIRLLEFLKQDRNVSLMSMEANTIAAEPGPLNNINFRLRIEV
ncbi:hypothetical protein SLEP1_g54743 [Rubroshorea leprosula]|uniref:BHLH domain-containing protein n=1 Tax=Rubroshorea leprosula TaxID=152421 RepID=A0AAV5MDD5_9ROSI|nr:hypothetical protein SLEP1_g54743 [Rubroshorea leprosula]